LSALLLVYFLQSLLVVVLMQAGAAGGNQQGVLPTLFGFQLGPGKGCHLMLAARDSGQIFLFAGLRVCCSVSLFCCSCCSLALQGPRKSKEELAMGVNAAKTLQRV
jgi:hypothetical protein